MIQRFLIKQELGSGYGIVSAVAAIMGHKVSLSLSHSQSHSDSHSPSITTPLLPIQVMAVERGNPEGIRYEDKVEMLKTAEDMFKKLQASPSLAHEDTVSMKNNSQFIQTYLRSKTKWSCSTWTSKTSLWNTLKANRPGLTASFSFFKKN